MAKRLKPEVEKTLCLPRNSTSEFVENGIYGILMVLSYNLYDEILLIHTKTKLRGVLFETQRKLKKTTKKQWSQMSYRNGSFCFC